MKAKCPKRKLKAAAKKRQKISREKKNLRRLNCRVGNDTKNKLAKWNGFKIIIPKEMNFFQWLWSAIKKIFGGNK